MHSETNQTRVVNRYKEAFDIYIGRGSLFGNPFPITATQSRIQVILDYKDYLYDRAETEPFFRKQLLSLRGKTLGCYCKPLPCHGDVIAQWLLEHTT